MQDHDEDQARTQIGDTGQVKSVPPRWKCHKEVQAFKIGEIRLGVYGHSATLIPMDDKIEPVTVSTEYMTKHTPKIGGYYVLYEDGYESFSPAAAFESGYALIDDAG